jgi:hypothetical protein
MPRQRRIQYEGAIYHLMSRGDRREEIFRDDLDREDFLKTLGAACQKLGGRSTPNRRRRSSSQQGSKKLGWGKRELTARRKSDPVKVALAGDLRSQTTMNLKWIARRLEMGSWTHVSNLLRQ